jgi:hypothetical protein
MSETPGLVRQAGIHRGTIRKNNNGVEVIVCAFHLLNMQLYKNSENLFHRKSHQNM